MENSPCICPSISTMWPPIVSKVYNCNYVAHSFWTFTDVCGRYVKLVLAGLADQHKQLDMHHIAVSRCKEACSQVINGITWHNLILTYTYPYFPIISLPRHIVVQAHQLAHDHPIGALGSIHRQQGLLGGLGGLEGLGGVADLEDLVIGRRKGTFLGRLSLDHLPPWLRLQKKKQVWQHGDLSVRSKFHVLFESLRLQHKFQLRLEPPIMLDMNWIPQIREGRDVFWGFCWHWDIASSDMYHDRYLSEH